MQVQMAVADPAAGWQPGMEDEFTSDRLTTGYGQLEQVEADLRRAEQDLLAAHRLFACRSAPRPELMFQKVVALRAQSRRLIEELGEEIVAG